MTVVEHVAHHLIAGGGEAQRPSRRDAEVVHRFAAQELADRAAQHGEAVGSATVRGGAGALELEGVAGPFGRDDLAQADGTAVTELGIPATELVPGINCRNRRRAFWYSIAGKHRQFMVHMGGSEYFKFIDKVAADDYQGFTLA